MRIGIATEQVSLSASRFIASVSASSIISLSSIAYAYYRKYRTHQYQVSLSASGTHAYRRRVSVTCPDETRCVEIRCDANRCASLGVVRSAPAVGLAAYARFALVPPGEFSLAHSDVSCDFCFDQRATSENNTSEEWGLIMEICDRAGASTQSAKECLRAVMRRLAHPDPHVQVHAATLLDACVANCGRAFHLEVASRDFETEFRRLMSRAQPAVAARLRGLLRKWAEGEFRDDPQLDLIPSLHAKLRAEPGEGAPRATAEPAAAAAAAQREQDELARAIALSLREAAPAPSAAPTLYPRVDAPAAAAAPPRKVRALYDFEAAEDNELTFLAGEIAGRGGAGRCAGGGRGVARGRGGGGGRCGGRGRGGLGADEPPSSIDEAAMDAALALLHEADPREAGAGAAEAALARLEARALAMGALVDAALERADRRHARLTQLSAELVDALNLYHSLMRDPLKPLYPPHGFPPPALHPPPPR
ncbi:unnamed protein product [Chrysodeixis includens]|uniref:VHS domain-containing protein n=1 Tax=Chrysodeixis includens TaxID=689277 RepID=A0A9N8KZ58_CHRIL|nr:unnamed protein product [Chrysodeixis includens]